MKLSIIIVNYKSAHFILECLRSANQFLSFKEFEWIIVDNNSNDNSKEIILNEFPNIIWHPMKYNAGFARANNVGIKISKSDTILLLNPDTLILDDVILKCYEKFNLSEYIACGVQLLNKDFSNQISGSHFMKGGLNHLLPLPYWGSFLKFLSKKINIRKPSIENASETENVDWISGAFLMVKKSVILKSGFMDEDFFLYGEEVEWCFRLGKNGQLCIFGDLKIIHIMGEIISSETNSNDKNYSNLFDKKGFQLILSNHVRIRKQYGVIWFLIQLLNYTLALPIFLIASFIENIFLFKNPVNDFKNVTGLTKNVIKVWLYSIKIIRNSPHFYKAL